VKTVYLDYNSTTPLAPSVKEEMMPFLVNFFGNPSSLHQLGRKARAHLDEYRHRMAAVWQCKPSEVVFTSGATESINLAIFGTARLLKAKGRHLITSSVEHHAVLRSFEYLVNKEGFDVSYLPVDSDGRINPPDLENALRDDTIFVSLMAANNEIGTIQPVSELGNICRRHGVIFHTDAVQWFGKEPFNGINQFNADLVSCCSHKILGPLGCGALFIKSPLFPDPIHFGGSHENERRSGTENLASIAGFVSAMEQFVLNPAFCRASLEPLSLRLIELSYSSDIINLVSPLEMRLSNTCSFSIPSCDSLTLLASLDLEGICASAGAACSSGSLSPSHVLLAMGRSLDEANSLIRFSLGPSSSDDDIDYVISVLPYIVKRILSS
jgi:cysteine desulfurase